MKYNQETRDKFIAALVRGEPNEYFDQQFPEIPTRTQRDWKKKARTLGTITPKKPTGRPSKLNARDERMLRRTVDNNPGDTVAENIQASGLYITHRTAMKYLKKYEIASIVAAKVPKLEPHHIAQRLRFAQRHMGKGEQ